MKELSIEEKAKRYDESKERMKDFLKEWENCGAVGEAMEKARNVFPELKESEDERIRSAMLRGFNSMYSNQAVPTFAGEPIRDIIAWLEKQGQVKDSAISQHENKTCKENGNSLTSEDERIRKAIIECVKNYGPSSANPKMFKNMLAWLEAQGKNNMGISEATKQKLEDNLNKALEKETPESWNEFLDEGEQKPAWSEEDELHIRELESLVKRVWAIAEHENDKDTIHEMSDLSFFIKTLKPQPKHEWSEADERNASYICAALDCYDRLREDRNNTNGQEDLDKARNWLYNRLKSLKPQSTWKPSDEQIKALEYIIDNTSNVSFSCNIVKGLLEQLKLEVEMKEMEKELKDWL